MSNLFNQLTEASQSLTDINHKLDLMYTALDNGEEIDHDLLHNLEDQRDDIESAVLDLEEDYKVAEEAKYNTVDNFR